MIERCFGSKEETFAAIMDLMPNPEKAFSNHPKEAGRLLIDLLPDTNTFTADPSS